VGALQPGEIVLACESRSVLSEQQDDHGRACAPMREPQMMTKDTVTCEASVRSGRSHPMAVAKVSEISATSTKSFEDAIQTGLARAHKTIRNVRSAWIKEQQVRLEGGKIVEYQVNMLLTFILDD
jgi:flavin-binding protein dodecin